MKKTGILLLMGLFLFQLFQGCNKTDDGTYTAPITLYESIGGTWKLTSLKQIDEIAKAGSAKPDEMLLTTKFSFNTFIIALNVDSTENGIEPATYEVQGTAPQLFNASGYWELDQAFPHTDNQATRIRLFSDAARTSLTDELIVTAIPGAKAALQFNLTRLSEGVPYVSYQYALKPVNQ